MSTMYADMAIDAIQNTKKSWVNQFVKDEQFAKPLNAFVDAQTDFAKQMYQSAWKMADATGNFAFVMQQALKGGK